MQETGPGTRHACSNRFRPVPASTDTQVRAAGEPVCARVRSCSPCAAAAVWRIAWARTAPSRKRMPRAGHRDPHAQVSLRHPKPPAADRRPFLLFGGQAASGGRKTMQGIEPDLSGFRFSQKRQPDTPLFSLVRRIKIEPAILVFSFHRHAPALGPDFKAYRIPDCTHHDGSQLLTDRQRLSVRSAQLLFIPDFKRAIPVQFLCEHSCHSNGALITLNRPDRRTEQDGQYQPPYDNGIISGICHIKRPYRCHTDF